MKVYENYAQLHKSSCIYGIYRIFTIIVILSLELSSSGRFIQRILSAGERTRKERQIYAIIFSMVGVDLEMSNSVHPQTSPLRQE